MRTTSNPGSPTSRSRSRPRRWRADGATCWTRSPTVARILVVDDDALLRGALRVALEAAGYEVIEAGDGRAALRAYHERGADLLLVDLFIPEPDGLEVIRSVRAEVPDAKIIAMSGGGRQKLDLLAAAEAFGAARAAWKAFAPSVRPAAARALLGGRGP